MVNTLLSVLSTMQPFHSNPTIAEQQTGPPSNMSTESLNTINFISSLRQQALLLGDYNAYRQLCSRRLSKLRKRLGKVKNSDLKSSKKDSYKLVPVTAHDIANENT